MAYQYLQLFICLFLLYMIFRGEVKQTEHLKSSIHTSWIGCTYEQSLEGVTLKSVKGREFCAIMSVPFAKPPVGPLRFKAPISEFNLSIDGTKDSPICIQNNPYTRDWEVVGQEDCLYLNVYVPKDALQGKIGPLPVMVFFHGGGWICGSGNKGFYGPERLMDEDVIYVGVNYRLGALGFLSTMDMESPGNYGLKDQQMALLWIKNHIDIFGGNKDSVTIFGESAGGASVHYHMMSPSSEGLFHRAISQSGTALCSWANAPPGLPLQNAGLLAGAVGCPLHNSAAMVECLRRTDAQKLVSETKHHFSWDNDPMIPFKPVVEPKHHTAFLTENPRVLITEGRFSHVPYMMGLNSKEGVIKSAGVFGNQALLDELSNDFGRLAPITFDYQNAENKEYITRKIVDYYLDGVTSLNNDSIHPLTDIYTDTYFLAGIDETLRHQHSKSLKPIYFYYFNYRGKNSFSEVFGDPSRDYGPSHVDELIYLFELGLFSRHLKGSDAIMSDIMLTMWTNFAKTGNPNIPKKLKNTIIPTWSPVTSADEIEYLEIGETLKTGNRLLEERRNLWHNLPLWHKKVENKLEKNEL